MFILGDYNSFRLDWMLWTFPPEGPSWICATVTLLMHFGPVDTHRFIGQVCVHIQGIWLQFKQWSQSLPHCETYSLIIKHWYRFGTRFWQISKFRWQNWVGLYWCIHNIEGISQIRLINKIRTSLMSDFRHFPVGACQIKHLSSCLLVCIFIFVFVYVFDSADRLWHLAHFWSIWI